MPLLLEQEENLSATDLPIDSPSTKMLGFMQKHYYQDHPIRQSNNFVVFPDFFKHIEKFLVPRTRGPRSSHSSIQAASSQCSSISCTSSNSPRIEPSLLLSPPSQLSGRSSSLSSREMSALLSAPTLDVKRTLSATKTQEVPSQVPKLKYRSDGVTEGQNLAARYCKRVE